MFYVYLVHCALLYSQQVDSIPKAWELCLCHKSLCTFFCEKAALFLSSQGMLSLWPSATPLKHFYVYLVKKGFPIVLLFRSDGYVSRSCPLNESARLSWSQYENALLLLTIKPRQLTVTDSQYSAPYCYWQTSAPNYHWQSKLGTILLLTIKTRHPIATDKFRHPTTTDNQNSAPTATDKPRHPTATDNQNSAPYCYW